MKLLVSGFLAVLGLFLAYSEVQAPEVDYWAYQARVTACNHRSRINCDGKILPKNKNICAVEINRFPRYTTKVYIPKIDKTFINYDNMYLPSVNKHYRLADKRGKDIDLVVDVYWNVPTKMLKYKDLGYTEIRIYR
jgi:hypothetical protein